MLKRGRGSIINVTSMVASKGVPGASAYSASKAAVESLTRTWAAEFGARGVRVNSVAPGPTKTEGVEAEWGDTNEELGRALPLGRTAEPEEMRMRCSFSRRRAQVSSPAQPCTPTVAAAPVRSHLKPTKEK